MDNTINDLILNDIIYVINVKNISKNYTINKDNDYIIITLVFEKVTIDIYFHVFYPYTVPIVYCNGIKFDGYWDMNIKDSQIRLLKFFDTFTNFNGDDIDITYGDTVQLTFPVSNERAKLAGWKPFITNVDVWNENIIFNELTKRSQEITHGSAETKIIIFGLGSVGSVVAEILVRNGIKKLVLVDIDIIEMHNIGRTTYTISDIGKKKTEALISKLLRINPFLYFELYEDDINKIPEKFIDIIKETNIVVVATDSNEANENISRISYGLGKQAVFIGLYDKGRGGEIVITGLIGKEHCKEIPCNNEKCYNTPCYACCTGRGTTNISIKKPHIIYGIPGEKLQGVTALSADIINITSFAVKIITALSLIKGNKGNDTELSNKLKEFIINIIISKVTYIRISTTQDELLLMTNQSNNELISGEFAYKYLWVNPSTQEYTNEARNTCNICGPNYVPIEKYNWNQINLDDINVALNDI